MQKYIAYSLAFVFFTAALTSIGSAAEPDLKLSALEISTLRACFKSNAQIPRSLAIALLLPSARETSLDDRKNYERIAAQTVAAACGTGAKLIVSSIQSRNFTADTLFSGRAPSPEEDNTALLLRLRATFVRQAMAAVERGLDLPWPTSPNDVLGAMQLSVHRLLGSPDSRRILVIDWHGWPEKRIFAYRHIPDEHDVAHLVADAHTLGMTLDGVEVVIAGISAQSDYNVTDAQFVALCGAWDQLVRNLNGVLLGCSHQLSDFLRAKV